MKRFPLVLVLSILAIAVIAVLAIAASRSEGGELADGNPDPEEIEMRTLPPAPVAVDTPVEGAVGESDYPSEDGASSGTVTDRAGDGRRPVRENAQEAETLDDLAPGDPTSVSPSDQADAPSRQQ